MQSISIIVPTYNEEKNVVELVQRIDIVCRAYDIDYEIIFVDDHSTDRTRFNIGTLLGKYQIKMFLKKGEKGKAFSLLEGFKYAQKELVGFIDADLQYPPEYLPSMMLKINDDADIVVADRSIYKDNPLRKISSKSFLFIFGRFLHGLRCDVQSGFKIFKKEVLKGMALQPKQWTFDLEFLINAREAGYSIKTEDIVFEKRHEGKSAVKMIPAMWEIGTNALMLKLKSNRRAFFLFNTIQSNRRKSKLNVKIK